MKNLKHLKDFKFDSKILGSLCIGSLSTEARKEVQKKVRSININAKELAKWVFSQVAHKVTGKLVVDDVCEGSLVTSFEVEQLSDEELNKFSEIYGGRFFGTLQHQDVAEGQPSGVNYLVFQIKETNRREREQYEQFQKNVKRLQDPPVVKAIRDAEQISKFINNPDWEGIKKTFHINRAWEDLRNLSAPYENMLKKQEEVYSWKTYIEKLHRLDSIAEKFDSVLQTNLGFSSALKQIQESQNWMTAFERAQNAYSHQSVLDSFTKNQATFHAVRQQWELPRQLVESVGALSALQKKIGRLTLPTLNWSSAAELFQILGPEGLQEHLAALGIDENGELDDTPEKRLLSPIQQDLLVLLSLILTILFFIYQEQSSGKWQENVDSKLNSYAVMLEQQNKQLEALSAILEKTLIKDTRISITRFVVLDRAALVYTQPQSGASVTGKLLPREVVALISENGKWIEVRYYNWISREYATGWVLKKYFIRVPPSRQDEG
ncbi:hypothetical protein ACO0K9_09305 [Undibacterium sp. Ji50W]|uniref:hypothetical protein n=1 Tax=Undibacterium sp. Ji50W TaxID=3413041 RepID=UPI003BF3B590